MEKNKEHTRVCNREGILLQERLDKAVKEGLLYAGCVLICAVLYFGWMRFYWPDFLINIVIICGPWCTAMLAVNGIRCVSLKLRLRKLTRDRQ